MAALTGIAYGGVSALTRPTRRSCGTRSPRSTSCPKGRVMTVTAGRTSLALTHYAGALRRARQPLPAPGRPARRGLDREGLAALPVARLRLLPAHRHAPARLHRRARVLPGRGPRRRHLRRAAARAAARRAPSPTSWSRRCARGASRTCSAWSATRISASPTRCAPPRRAATSRSSASATRARPRSRRRRTASSPDGSRRASRSRGRARPTCSPVCTTRRSTARRCSRSRARCRRRCAGAARSRISISPPRSPTSRSPRRPCSATPTTSS